MDLWVYAVLFICGLALYAFAYRQGQKDEKRVVQAWLDAQAEKKGWVGPESSILTLARTENLARKLEGRR